jgi:sugar/nucleoside kinase (ribokinase family)
LNSGAFLICPMDFEVTTETISRLNSLNKLMMADLGGFGGAVSTMHPSTGNEKDKKNVKNIISKFDIIKASIEDCYYLFKDSMSYEEIIKTLHRWGAEIVLITLGDKGSVISNRNNLINIPAFEANMIDTTGAGDVYCATFLVEYLKTKDLYKSGLYASAAASILIEKTGGVNLSRMPTDKKIKKKIKSSSNN